MVGAPTEDLELGGGKTRPGSLEPCTNQCPRYNASWPPQFPKLCFFPSYFLLFFFLLVFFLYMLGLKVAFVCFCNGNVLTNTLTGGFEKFLPVQ